VLLKEKLNIYLYIVRQKTNFRLIIKKICQLINIIYYVFYKILEIINNLYIKEIQLFINCKFVVFRIRKASKF